MCCFDILPYEEARENPNKHAIFSGGYLVHVCFFDRPCQTCHAGLDSRWLVASWTTGQARRGPLATYLGLGLGRYPRGGVVGVGRRVIPATSRGSTEPSKYTCTMGEREREACRATKRRNPDGSLGRIKAMKGTRRTHTQSRELLFPTPLGPGFESTAPWRFPPCELRAASGFARVLVFPSWNDPSHRGAGRTKERGVPSLVCDEASTRLWPYPIHLSALGDWRIDSGRRCERKPW
ncbi:hypothetical protein B0T24DRAFT_335240 [Lasiosphaeria ovina]|uniref:Uncharacterized protein n=1 Tax=Lasiosphaeria ovina TaxID=92902 RepID=A0AAE0N664_9PEZI|nr:hypothetical protein B0T24DRAFT_335240 [Lasiosphaeria ovina]